MKRFNFFSKQVFFHGMMVANSNDSPKKMLTFFNELL